MSTVRLATNSVGGTIQGQYGTYQPASDGTITVDTRDAATLLAAGMSYVANRGDSYTTPFGPAAATAGQIVASAALSNGAVAIANQPDIMRPVNFIFGPGTTALTAGTVSVTYIGNDQQTHTDVLSVVAPASTNITTPLSRGAVSISTIVAGGITGGTSPFVRADTTAAIAVPCDPGAQDFLLNNEIADSTRATLAATFAAASIGCVTVHTAPNGTHTYSLAYAYTSPNI